MTPDDARRTVAAFIQAAERVATGLGRDLLVVNRSDSTLRGHSPVEVEQIVASTGGKRRYRRCLLVLAFPEAGRVTLDGIHYLRVGDRLNPVAETKFATDSTFGYTESRLTDWARSRVPEDWRVVHLPSSAIDRGFDAVVEFLDHQSGFSVLCPSVRDDADLAVLADAQRRLHRLGVNYLVQAEPAYARHLARTGAHGTADVDSPGLVVVGSHTKLTTGQLTHAHTTHQLHHVEIDDTTLLGDAAEVEIERCTADTATALATHSVVLSTSRTRQTGTDQAHSLTIANQIGAGVAEIARPCRRLAAELHRLQRRNHVSRRCCGFARLGGRPGRGPLVDRTLAVWSGPDRYGRAGGTGLVIFLGNIGALDLLSRALDQLSVPRVREQVGAGA